MLNLREYQKKSDKLSDFLPWAAFVAPGVVLNKDGSFQKSYAFRGPDLDSATPAELVSITARLNNAIKRLSGGWAIYTEAQRMRSQEYPESGFPDPVTLLIEEERRVFFSLGNHYESLYYLTLLYLPPPERHQKVEKAFIERGKGHEKEQETYQAHLKAFITETDRIYSLLSEVLPEARPLTDSETLTYLHSCISPKRHPVIAPEIPMYIDALLADTPLISGFEPRLGDYHLRVISIMGFPGSTVPGLLDNLNRLNFGYRWVTRYLPMDKRDALSEIGKYRRQWFAKRKSVGVLIKETITQTESAMVDNDAMNKAADADAALQEVADDIVSYGYYTASIIVWDKDPILAQKKVRAVEKTITSLGFTVINETVNAVDAWFGSLPCIPRANVRRPLMSSMNLAHIFPLSAPWAGPEMNTHLNAPVLMHTETSGNTPFRLNLNIDDVGHTMIVGPTGSGKSVLLAILAAQFRRYKDAQIYFFDKDGSIKALTAGVGGDFYDLGADTSGGTLSFQPLAAIDNELEISWAAEWIYDFLRAENVEVNPDVKKAVWTALKSLSSSPPEQRTLTGFTLLLQDTKLRQALEPATIAGSFGRLFDSSHDTLSYGRWQVFEMAKLMETRAAVPPALSYLFHRLEQRFTGSPTILFLDECWLFLDNPIFAAKIREWLKVLRKANVAVVFATQSLQDVENSSISAVIKESCPTKIYLPNSNALDERMAAIYQGYGLNSREVQIIGTATPKRQYYYKSPEGSRLFDLALGPLALAYCGSSSPDDRKMVSEIQAAGEDFNNAWLRYKNLDSSFFETVQGEES
ncbi:MAG: conjugal transfer protein TrbE [Syntrophobacterales bacterium]|jgi:type IV secretion system protein VirB4|nr:conjugal transfer protein TrbE [Syntrophobacterales bacterium]